MVVQMVQNLYENIWVSKTQLYVTIGIQINNKMINIGMLANNILERTSIKYFSMYIQMYEVVSWLVILL